jgi:hypothetical protein
VFADYVRFDGRAEDPGEGVLGGFVAAGSNQVPRRLGEDGEADDEDCANWNLASSTQKESFSEREEGGGTARTRNPDELQPDRNRVTRDVHSVLGAVDDDGGDEEADCAAGLSQASASAKLEKGGSRVQIG